MGRAWLKNHPAGAPNVQRHPSCLCLLTSTAIATAIATAAVAAAAAAAIAAADWRGGGLQELVSC